jgi:hypothetical protein
MESSMGFSLQRHIADWMGKIQSEPAVTEADAEELKSHLLDLIDDLIAAGLDEEEAFWVASKRLGNSTDWGGEYRLENNPVIQMRRSVIILAGVLAYFLCYYFILSTSKLLFITLLFNDVDGYMAADWVSRYLITFHFGFVLFFASIFFLEKKTVALIENIKMRPNHALILLATTVILAIADTCLYPIAKKLMGDNVPLHGYLYHFYRYFDFSFPLLISVGFVFIYFKYYKKVKF